MPSASTDHQHSLSPDTTPLSPVKSPPDEVSSYPLAAQIPLQSFSLPTFPPEASHLRELTLTSDIKLDEYQDLLRGTEYELPQLPQSLTHLTLELFSLGFPGRNPKFLSNLALALPNLKSATFFATLLDGLSDPSRTDAEAFFDLTRQLREVHIIDSFVRPGFWPTVANLWSQRAREAGSVKVVEISYTYRGHDDSDFLAKLHGEELPLLLVPGMVGFGSGLIEAAEGPDLTGTTQGDAQPQPQAKASSSTASGILPFANDSRATVALKSRFTTLTPTDLSTLKVINLSLWTLTATDLASLLSRLSPSSTPNALVDLTISVLLEDNWFSTLTSALRDGGSQELQGLEIIGVPAKANEQGDDDDWPSSSGLIDQVNDVAKLGVSCPKLAKFEMSILKAQKAGDVTWQRDMSGKWELRV